MAGEPITILETTTPFIAVLPDGSTFKDSITMDKAELGRTSHDELVALAEARVQAHIDFLADPGSAQATQDATEIIAQIEGLCDLSDPDWAANAFQPGTQTNWLLNDLANRMAVARPLIEDRATDEQYGPLWAQWLAAYPVG